MAAVLAAGGEGVAALSHSSAAAFFGIGVERAAGIEVTRLSADPIRRQGRQGPPASGTQARLVRPAQRDPGHLAGADADRPRGAARPTHRWSGSSTKPIASGSSAPTTSARRSISTRASGEWGGCATILDRRTFRYTRSELERAFLPLARAAGLPLPRTSVYVNGHEVDFHFPTLDLVVETDGLTYHRTPAQQAKDLERDHDHSAAGTHRLRFSHGQIRYEPDRVVRILRATASRLTASGPPRPRSAAVTLHSRQSLKG